VTTARMMLLVIDLPRKGCMARVSQPLQDTISRSCSLPYRKGPGKAASARCCHSFSWRRKKITPVVIKPIAATSNSKLTGLVTRLISHRTSRRLLRTIGPNKFPR
jgi:hypothetical protein